MTRRSDPGPADQGRAAAALAEQVRQRMESIRDAQQAIDNTRAQIAAATQQSEQDGSE